MPDVFVRDRRDKAAARRFLRRPKRRTRLVPRVVVTDKLRSHDAAHREVLPPIEHRSHKGMNNRAEDSHQPTRRRERAMKGFRGVGGAAVAVRVQRHPAPASTCASHPPGRPGRTWRNAGSPSRRTSGYGEASTAASRPRRRTSAPGSPHGTPTPSPASGRRPQTRSSNASPVIRERNSWLRGPGRHRACAVFPSLPGTSSLPRAQARRRGRHVGQGAADVPRQRGAAFGVPQAACGVLAAQQHCPERARARRC